MKLIGTTDNFNWDMPLWRYMSLEKFESIFSTGTLYFASAQQFSANDLHEGAICEKEYLKRVEIEKRYCVDEDTLKEQLRNTEEAFARLRALTKISCWHFNTRENMAMWLNYRGANAGIAIQTTPALLRNFLGPYRIKPDYSPEDIFIAPISYINYETGDYNSSYGFLTPYLHKREQYAYEQEIRLIISLRTAEEFGVQVPEDGILVPFDFRNGISRIVVAPNSSPDFITQVNQILQHYNMSISCDLSEMTKVPKY